MTRSSPRDPAQVDDDRLRRPDRRTREPGPDPGRRRVVAGQGDLLVPGPARGEVAAVGRVDAGEVGGGGTDEPVDVGGVVPEVGVPARGHAHQLPDVEHRPAAAVGGQQARHPRVVAGAVLDRHLGVGQRPGVGCRRLVGMGVGVRVVDDAHHVGVGAADLGDDAAPEVLGRHHPHHAGRVGDRSLPRRREAGGTAASARATATTTVTTSDRVGGKVRGPGTAPAYMGMILITTAAPALPDVAAPPVGPAQLRSARPASSTSRATVTSSRPRAVTLARDLEDGRDALEGRVAEQGGQTVGADRAVPDVLMAVPVGPEVDLGVVEVQATQPSHPHGGVDQVDQGVGLVDGPERDAGRPQVLGVEADPEPLVAVRGLDDLGELLEGPSDGVTRPGGVLEEDRTALDVGVDLVEGADQGFGHGRKGGCEPAPPVAPDVEDQAGGAHPVGGRQVGGQAGP